jgi:hypothetical protein
MFDDHFESHEFLSPGGALLEASGDRVDGHKRGLRGAFGMGRRTGGVGVRIEYLQGGLLGA